MAPPAADAALLNTYFIDSETELDFLFRNGEIDPEQYELLEEFFSVLPYTVQDTSISPLTGLTEVNDELEFFGDSMAIQELSPTIFSEILPYFQWFKGTKTSLSYKIYHDLDADEARRELVNLSGRPIRNFSYYVETEKNEDHNEYYFRKRVIKFSYGRLMTEMGNYNSSWGMGVTLGYYSDFLDKDENPASNSLLFPAKGRLNGIRLQYDSRISPLVMLSYDRSKTANGRMAGFGLDYRWHDASVGILCNYHRIENLISGDDYSNLIMGSSIEWKSKQYSFQSEMSESEGKYFAWSMNMIRKLERGRFALSAWNYPKGYINPYGGGKANSDYTTIDIPDTELEYSSRQYGEWGVLSQSQYLLFENHLASIAANYWLDGGEEEKLRLKISDQLALGPSLDMAVTYLWGDDNLSDDYGLRQHLRFDLLYGKTPRNMLRFSTELKRIYYSYGRRDIARFELKAVHPLSKRINSVVKFSRIDYDMSDGAPGYWLIYLSEDITFGDYIFVRAILDTREGVNYNLINSARFNLQITLMAD